MSGIFTIIYLHLPIVILYMEHNLGRVVFHRLYTTNNQRFVVTAQKIHRPKTRDLWPSARKVCDKVQDGLKSRNSEFTLSSMIP